MQLKNADIIYMEEIMLTGLAFETNVKELHDFLKCSVYEAVQLTDKGYTKENIIAYYGELPGDWLLRLIYED